MIFDKKKFNKNGEIDKKHTIMVVDDVKVVLTSLVSLFSDKYKVLTATDGQEALEYIRKMDQPEEIRLIISDQRMSGLTGLQLFKAIKDIIPNTIRFIITAFDETSVILEAINAVNVHQFILKPFKPEDLLQRVEFALKYFDQQRELDEYHKRLKKMVEERTHQLTKSIAIKDIFLSMFTHDLGNQILNLAYPIHKLYRMQDINDDEIRGYIDDIYNGQNRTSKLSKSLLDWAISTKGEITAHPKKIDIHALANENIELFEDKAKSKKILLSSEVEPDTIAFADKNMILSVIRNLISNAVNFTKKGGWVKIRATSGNEFVEVSVCDNGIGMSSEEVDRLFRDDLLNSKNGTTGEKGTGMGLKICIEFVEMNNGTIEVTSEPGKGTCFKFTLPIKASKSLLPKDKRFQSVFISYGGPDEPFAERLNNSLIQCGVNTFFFLKDARPGDKLSRVMREEINKHDRVVLICSRNSLERPGVVNELEETLQREARQGGAAVLIPITLDDYVFSDWAPQNPDLAQAVRDRVVADFRGTLKNEILFKEKVDLLISALKR